MKQSLAAKKTLIVVLLGILMTSPVQAGIPVIDWPNLPQSILTTIETVAQTGKQIQQYKTQLQQYEAMLQNSVTADKFLWDNAQSTINNLMNAINTLDYYKREMGNIDAFLGKFQDVTYYQNS
ncbi:MAG: conjugal transfer protein TrbJ, partial [Desulfuromusa sp.]|nr:conjugal transfer protein TrbJ [Desulfuromusa sp.]